MPNIISSAIADIPETEMVSDTLNKRNRVHHLDTNTDEDMIPIFTHDVNNKPRNNKRLLPRRNWCSIREYQPGKHIARLFVVFFSFLILTTKQAPPRLPRRMNQDRHCRPRNLNRPSYSGPCL